MNPQEPRFIPDQWLTGQLGKECFRLSLPEGGASTETWKGSVKELLRGCPRSAFCYVKVPTSQAQAVRYLTEAGFTVVDVNMILEREPGPTGVRPPEDVQVHPFLPGEASRILDIAGACFRFSRFHLDDRILESQAHALKRAWVENYTLERRGEELLTAVHEGRPVGFLAVLATTDNGKKARIIDLVGVAPDFQGCGAGKALVEYFCVTSQGRSDLVRVGTQAANTPSLRLYQAMGFKAVGSAYVLHAHL